MKPNFGKMKKIYNFLIFFFLSVGYNRFDDQIFVNKNSGIPNILRFHPYEAHLAVADKDNVR